MHRRRAVTTTAPFSNSANRIDKLNAIAWLVRPLHVQRKQLSGRVDLVARASHDFVDDEKENVRSYQLDGTHVAPQSV